MAGSREEQETGAIVGDGSGSAEDGGAGAGKGRHRRRRVGIAVLVVVVVVLAAVGIGLRAGLIVPGNAAARYDGNRYISESQISAYIASYRKQAGLENSTDALWAGFLDEQGLTPEALRNNTVQQLVTDAMVQKKADEENVTVDEDAFQLYMDTIKGNLAFGDDDIYRSTLESQGQTVEQAEEGYRNLFLQRALFEKVVPVPEVSDEQLKHGLANAYPSGVTTKHIYLFTIDGFDDEGSYAKFAKVQEIRELFANGDASKESFAALVQTYSNNDDLKSRNGNDGWSLDIADRSEEYQQKVEELQRGGVSEVFRDTSGYSFIWIDREFTLPPSDADGVDLDAIPDTLRDYFRDSVAHQLWQVDCQEYLQQLFVQSNTVVYAMPADVPYNVDMSLADAADGDAENEERG